MLKNPTLRKVRNRGWEPVAYRTDTGVRHGRKRIHLLLPLDRALQGEERRREVHAETVIRVAVCG